MHKLGVLSESDVNTAYHEIGYNNDKAAKLTAFTLLLNAEDIKLEKAQERDLTLSMIRSAYQDGMLEDSDLTSMVNDLGYDPAESELIIGMEQYNRQLKIRRKQLDIIKQRVMYDKIDLNSAIDQMNKIGLPAHEVSYQLLDLQMDLELKEAKAETAESKKAAADAAKAVAAREKAAKAEADRIRAEVIEEQEKAEADAAKDLTKDLKAITKKQLAIIKQRVVLKAIDRNTGINLMAAENINAEQLQYYVLDLQLALEKQELKERLASG